MPKIIVRNMLPEDEYFVSTCSHVNESEETNVYGRRRIDLLHDLIGKGAVVKAALLSGEHVGFAYGVPIEHSSWGPIGEGLMVIPCLYVQERGAKKGIGRVLMESIEQDAQDAGRTGTTLMGFRDLPGAEWLLPVAFFEHIGYKEVDHRGRYVLLWKPFSDKAEAPSFLDPSYVFEPVEGKVVVDLFWNEFCQTSGIEAQRVREVCAEFGDRVFLNESCAEDHKLLLACGIERAIYINGQEIGWGYEAPKDGIRKAIEQALPEA
ncbi:MAG: GNAT family N-acetyltransferase [Candidatus Bipolaricaulia bacterium]